MATYAEVSLSVNGSAHHLTLDTSGVNDRKQGRSKYGAKRTGG